MPDKPDQPHPDQPDQPGAVSFPSIGDNPQFAGADDADLSTLHTRLDEDAPETTAGENVLTGDAEDDAPTQTLSDEAATVAPAAADDEMPTVVEPTPAPPAKKKPVTEDDLINAYLKAGLFTVSDGKPNTRALLSGRYAISRLIGRGGMGVVFLARDRQADCDVALKTIHPNYLKDADARKRFIDEARQMARIPSHASVLVVKDVSDTERPFYTMEFMHKGSLGRLIREQGALDRDTTLRLAQSIAKAIDYVHVSAGAIHRDIKPENVLLAEDGTARLCDFGLIRRVGSGAVGLRAGTLAYMPPEVVSGGGKNVGFEWDIYSMGALLYEMLTGKPPYAEAMGSSSGTGTERIDALKKAVTDSAPRPILSLNRKADRGLVAIAQWAMARNKRERYVQVADLLADLERVASNQKPLGPQQSGAAANKRKTGVAALLLVFIAAAAYGAFVYFGNDSDSDSEKDHAPQRSGLTGDPTIGVEKVASNIPSTGFALIDDSNPDAHFRLNVQPRAGEVVLRNGDKSKTNGEDSHFHDDEPMLFAISPSRKSVYLHVLFFDLDPNSNQPLLLNYPFNDEERRKLIPAGDSVDVPSHAAIAAYRFITAGPPYHRAILKVIATTKPVSLADIDTNQPKVIVGNGDDKIIGQSIAEVLGPDEWATYELLVTTGPPGSTGPDK